MPNSYTGEKPRIVPDKVLIPRCTQNLSQIFFFLQNPIPICPKARVQTQKGADILLAELRQKAQITIPKEIIIKLGLSEGDKLDIFEKDGFICLVPVAVYPKKYLNELKEEINGVKARLASGEQPVFDSVDALFDKLDAD
jgi:AbrB family looped-hinge helix DNA binding protein